MMGKEKGGGHALQYFFVFALCVVSGYTVWYESSKNDPTICTLSAPIYFYNTGSKVYEGNIENTNISVSVMRKYLPLYKNHPLEVNLDLAGISGDKTELFIHPSTILLPAPGKVINVSPQLISLSVQ